MTARVEIVKRLGNPGYKESSDAKLLITNRQDEQTERTRDVSGSYIILDIRGTRDRSPFTGVLAASRILFLLLPVLLIPEKRQLENLLEPSFE